MLYLPLQPCQQVSMATHSYSFPEDSKVTFQMLVRERKRKYHPEKVPLSFLCTIGLIIALRIVVYHTA